MAETVIRYQIADYMNVSDNISTQEWQLMGVGFNTLDENPRAQIDTKAYISDASASSVTKGYQTQFPFDTDLIASDKAIMKLYDIGRNQLTGGGVEFDYVRVELFRPVEGAPNTFTARKFRVAAEVAGMAGTGAEIVHVTGNLNNVGSFVDGQFNTATKTFTASEVDTVVVSPTTATVAPGETQAFTVVVSGENSPAQTVNWTVTGGTSGDTDINNGLLTVAEDETATTLTVTATSTVDTTKSGTASVTVSAA